MTKTWKIIDDSCPICGDDVEVYTDAEAGRCYDGDACRCASCDWTGGMSVDEGGEFWIQ